MKAVVQFVFMVLLVVALAEAGSYASLYALGASNKSFSEIYDPTGNTARYSGKCNDYLQTVELDPTWHSPITNNAAIRIAIRSTIWGCSTKMPILKRINTIR